MAVPIGGKQVDHVTVIVSTLLATAACADPSDVSDDWALDMVANEIKVT